MTPLMTKITRAIAAKLVRAQAVKKTVVLLPTEFILRGFFFERTSAKNSYYLSRLVLPIFSPFLPHIVLNYSTRISLDGRTQALIRIDDADEIFIHDLCEQLRREEIPKLDEYKTIHSFLSAFESAGMDWLPNVKLEMAFAHLLTGDFNRGNIMLDEILHEPIDSPIMSGVQEQTRLVAQASRVGAAALLALAYEMKKKNLSFLFPGIVE